MAKTRIAKPRKPREPKAKQAYLPGTEPPSVPEIDDQAEAYRDARNSRMELQKDETAQQDLLLGLMHKHKLETYEYNGYVVQVAPKEKVSVRKKPGAEGNGDE